MRIRYRLWYLGVVAGLALGTVAHADAPADLDGLVLRANGHIRVGGNIDFVGLQDFEYDFAGIQITISDIDGDPTQIQIDTVLPAPDIPCNRGRDFSIRLTGIYDPATGAVQVTGVRPGTNKVDTGGDLYFLGFHGVHAELNTVTMSLNGTADDDGTGAVTITGLDRLPDRGGPSTNLSVVSARGLLIDRPGCDIVRFTLNVNRPYGGFTWVATP
ncbi:MAG: hypothetical protein HYR55_00550 [Acidobacteria bacterium]|nr:hypothetical protein [Acidobacteriota bacterium]